MADTLAALEYEPAVVCHRNGLDCSERTYGTLVTAVERIARTTGEPVRLLAFSRGGQLARVLAVRRPDLVRGLVTLGTPFVGGLGPLRLGTRLKIIVLGLLGSLGVQSLVTLGCLGSGCCRRFWQDLTRPLPEHVRLASIYSEDDRTVGTAAVQDPRAELVAVSGGHADLIRTPPAIEAVTRALAEPPVSASDPQRK